MHWGLPAAIRIFRVALLFLFSRTPLFPWPCFVNKLKEFKSCADESRRNIYPQWFKPIRYLFLCIEIIMNSNYVCSPWIQTNNPMFVAKYLRETFAPFSVSGRFQIRSRKHHVCKKSTLHLYRVSNENSSFRYQAKYLYAKWRIKSNIQKLILVCLRVPTKRLHK